MRLKTQLQFSRQLPIGANLRLFSANSANFRQASLRVVGAGRGVAIGRGYWALEDYFTDFRKPDVESDGVDWKREFEVNYER